MNREEAVACLKEILALSQHMSPNAVTFEKSLANEISTGYRVRIKGSTFDDDRQAVNLVAKNHKLVVKEEDNEIVIYQPRAISTLL